MKIGMGVKNMGDRDSKHVFDENWEDDKSRLLARKSSSKRSSLLRDAINAVDAALGTDRKSKQQQDIVPSEEVLQIQDMNQVRAIEPKTSQEIIEQALIEMKTHSEVDLAGASAEQNVSEPQVQDDSSSYPQNNSANQGRSQMAGDVRASDGDIDPLQGKLDPGRTQRVRMPSRGPSPSFYQEPVVAWLVIVQGPGLGSFKPIYEGNNTIGRASNQHIQLDFGDETISAEEQAFIRYDPQERSYLFIPNLSKTNVVSLNEDKPTSAVELKSMDIITMGQTRMAFVPFCGNEFDWSDIA